MKSFALSLFAPLATAAIVARQTASNWTIGQTVQTSSGPVSGHAARNATAATVSEYLGIPFAQAPTGNLRFAAPVAFEGTAAINASIYVSPHFHPAHIRRKDWSVC
jgi:cholinesterase